MEQNEIQDFLIYRLNQEYNIEKWISIKKILSNFSNLAYNKDLINTQNISKHSALIQQFLQKYCIKKQYRFNVDLYHLEDGDYNDMIKVFDPNEYEDAFIDITFKRIDKQQQLFIILNHDENILQNYSDINLIKQLPKSSTYSIILQAPISYSADHNFDIECINNLIVKLFRVEMCQLHNLRLKHPEKLEYISLCYSGYISLSPYENLITLILDQTYGVRCEEFKCLSNLKHLDVNMCMNLEGLIKHLSNKIEYLRIMNTKLDRIIQLNENFKHLRLFKLHSTNTQFILIQTNFTQLQILSIDCDMRRKHFCQLNYKTIQGLELLTPKYGQNMFNFYAMKNLVQLSAIDLKEEYFLNRQSSFLKYNYDIFDLQNFRIQNYKSGRYFPLHEAQYFDYAVQLIIKAIVQLHRQALIIQQSVKHKYDQYQSMYALYTKIYSYLQ